MDASENYESLATSETLKDAMVQSSMASRDLISAAVSEANLMEAWLEDFADSELDMGGVHRLMLAGLPEVGSVRSNDKSPKVITSPEALIAMTKATELFILDLTLKTFQSKALEPNEEKRISTQLNLDDLRMAVRNEDNFDFVDAVTAPPPPPEARVQVPVPAAAPPSKAKSSSKARKR